MRYISVLLLSAWLLSTIPPRAQAEPAAPLSTLARMPVKEVTVFKDGHALLLHEGNMPTDSLGNVIMDYLPTPVLGTFWPYSADKNAKLRAVVSSQRKVLVPRTALNLRELLKANAGAEVHVEELSGTGENAKFIGYEAKILGIPTRQSEELEATSPPGSGEKLPEIGNIILLKTSTGTAAIPVNRIQTLTFKGDHSSKTTDEEFRNLLTLNLDWGGRAPGKTAEVGMMYVQKGLRWIPNYKMVLDGNGNASIKLQATLINELADLQDVTAHLVIGVPTFAFKQTPDPISMQQAIAKLSPYFDQDARTRGALSNAIMSQMAPVEESWQSSASGLETGPEVSESAKNEDLFVFTLKHLTLKKGQCMVLPVVDCDLKYKDVYTLDLPFAPPLEVQHNVNDSRQAALLKSLALPRVMHKIRLSNKSAYPLTTAPVLIMHGNKVLAQGMITYTAAGASGDLEVTAAVDVKVKKSDRETSRTPNAVRWQGNEYARVDLSGTISLTNYADKAAELEVKRWVLGKIDSADHGGSVEAVNVFEESMCPGESDCPSWWGPYTWPAWWSWYSWPSWWNHLNGVGRANWKLTLEPHKSVDLGYAWHYFWR